MFQEGASMPLRVSGTKNLKVKRLTSVISPAENFARKITKRKDRVLLNPAPRLTTEESVQATGHTKAPRVAVMFLLHGREKPGKVMLREGRYGAEIFPVNERQKGRHFIQEKKHGNGLETGRIKEPSPGVDLNPFPEKVKNKQAPFRLEHLELVRIKSVPTGETFVAEK